MQKVIFTNLKSLATGFLTRQSALSAMSRCTLPAVFAAKGIRSFEVKPTDDGLWIALVTNGQGFIRYVSTVSATSSEK